jgi:hypothetical protein
MIGAMELLILEGLSKKRKKKEKKQRKKEEKAKKRGYESLDGHL